MFGRSQLTIADITKEDMMFRCPCGSNSKAIFYCEKGCNPKSLYYCMACDQIHDHKLTKIAQETQKHYNECSTINQEIKENYQKIKKIEDKYLEFF